MDCGKLLVCWLVYNTDGWTDGEMDRQKDRQTDRQTDLVDLTLLSFLDIWRKRFSTQLQKCNAKVIMRKISTLTNDIDCTVDCSTQFFSH